jgi:cyclic pyranopterin phosphate synthase
MGAGEKSTSPELSHLDEQGRAVMVDVGGKSETRRYARAWGVLELASATLELMCSGKLAKGDVFAAARLAGIMAAKRCGDLIPLCHPLPLDWVGVELIPCPASAGRRAQIVIIGEAALNGRTGIEMEALLAVTVAGLTLYDMGKAVDRGMSLGQVALLEKKGGRSGHYVAPERAVRLAKVHPCRLEDGALLDWCCRPSGRLEFSCSGLPGKCLGETAGPLPLPLSEAAVVVLGTSLLLPDLSVESSPSSASGRLRVIRSGAIGNDGVVAVLA